MNDTPPWITTQLHQLLAQRGHAWLLQGPSGLGQYPLALALVRAWLCEQPSGEGACGQCPSCHAIDVRTHADLCVLMPETAMIERGWPLDEKSQADIDDKKRKPSKEIRVEAMRDAIEFAQRTSSRGRGKAVLIYPAERMNQVTANALLKTLEEPPGEVRFVLASEAAHQLLPTIRSRCQSHAMVWPPVPAAAAWLGDQGLAAEDAAVFLRAAGGRHDDALQLARGGWSPQTWRSLPAAMRRGDSALVTGWTAPQLVDALHKLCHDLQALGVGAQPRYFAQEDLPPAPPIAVLGAWQQELQQSSRHAEHPFNAGLMIEALVSRASTALQPS